MVRTVQNARIEPIERAVPLVHLALLNAASMMRLTTPRLGTLAVSSSLGWIAGVYVVFPAALALACRLRPRPVRSTGPRPGSVTVIVAAHDEERSIGAKLDDIAAQDLDPSMRVEVIVASDGSSDRTVSIATEHGSRPMVLDLPRRGKAAALNRALARASGDVIVFTDANSRLGPEAFAAVLGPFSDPEVGGVAGDQRYEERPSGPGAGERDYWAYERRLKRWESCIGSTVSSTGALHAVRLDLVDPVPVDVTDDFFISTGVIAAGRRLVFAADAIAWEAPNDSSGAEYRRRVRIITRGLTAIRRRRMLLDPRRTGVYALVLFVHKVARRVVFVPMLLLFVGAGALRTRRPWCLVFGAQCAAYVMAAVGAVSPRSRLGRHRMVALPTHFCVANVAAAHGVFNVLRSRRYVVWTPERS